MSISKSESFLNLPKVLVCCPTAKSKNYCFEEWVCNVMDFTYPNFEIVMYDNTNKNGENAKILRHKYERIFGLNKFKAKQSKISNNMSILEKMCISHNDCREYLLNSDCEYMLHLESDVIPEVDIIESLMFHKKKVVGGVYYTDEGLYRKAMIQQMIDVGFGITISKNFGAKEDIYFIDGSLKKVASVGLGCVLIHRSVFNKIKFRFEKNVEKYPDSYFSEDCFRNGIGIYLDTSKIAIHKNQIWLK